MPKKTISRKEFEDLLKSHESLTELVMKVAEHDVKSCNNHRKITSKQINLLGICAENIAYIVHLLQILFFIQMMVITDLYLSEKMRQALISLVKSFATLSEAWQIAVVTLLASLPIGILITVGGELIIEQINRRRE